MNTTAKQDHGTGSVDIARMRQTAARLLGVDDAPATLPPVPSELDALTAMLRDDLELLIPQVAAKARRLPRDSVSSYCARACIGEATRKLRLGDGGTPAVRASVAGKLARSLKALCDHYERLDGEARASTQP